MAARIGMITAGTVLGANAGGSGRLAINDFLGESDLAQGAAPTALVGAAAGSTVGAVAARRVSDAEAMCALRSLRGPVLGSALFMGGYYLLKGLGQPPETPTGFGALEGRGKIEERGVLVVRGAAGGALLGAAFPGTALGVLCAYDAVTRLRAVM